MRQKKELEAQLAAMPKPLTQRERSQNRWLKQVEPKEKRIEERALNRAKQIVGMLQADLLKPANVGVRKASVHWIVLIKQAIMLEHARGVHEGASNPYC